MLPERSTRPCLSRRRAQPTQPSNTIPYLPRNQVHVFVYAPPCTYGVAQRHSQLSALFTVAGPERDVDTRFVDAPPATYVHVCTQRLVLQTARTWMSVLAMIHSRALCTYMGSSSVWNLASPCPGADHGRPGTCPACGKRWVGFHVHIREISGNEAVPTGGNYLVSWWWD